MKFFKIFAMLFARYAKVPALPPWPFFLSPSESGANTAIFSLIDAVILKSLPVRDPEQFLQVMMGTEAYGGYSNPTWEHLRDRQDVFSGIFAYGRWGFNLASGGEAHSVHGAYVSGEYFDTLGVHAVLGRTLSPADDSARMRCKSSPELWLLATRIWRPSRCPRQDNFPRQTSDRDCGRYRTRIRWNRGRRLSRHNGPTVRHHG